MSNFDTEKFVDTVREHWTQQEWISAGLTPDSWGCCIGTATLFGWGFDVDTLLGIVGAWGDDLGGKVTLSDFGGRVREAIVQAIHEVDPKFTDGSDGSDDDALSFIVHWNDDLETTHTMAVRVAERAAAILSGSQR